MPQTPSIGLQSTIWNNNLKSIVLLCLYPFILAAVVFAVFGIIAYFGAGGAQDAAPRSMAFATQMTLQYWPIILCIVILWFFVSYLFQGAMIRAMSKSHSVTRKEEPELYNLVENMCIATGTKMPRVEIIETHARNAFASGINDQTYCITVTRGLMQSLSKDELEAVLAHELTHILNRDVRLMMVCVVFTGMLGMAAQLLWSNVRYGLWIPRDRGKSSGGAMILLFAILAVLWIGYLATLLARFAISRKREYMADAGAVQITKNPDAMMRALMRISGMANIPESPGDIKAMCFENAQPFMGLFATHPPIQTRIAAISGYTGLPVPALAPKARAEDSDVFARPPLDGVRTNWTTRERFRGRRTSNPWL